MKKEINDVMQEVVADRRLLPHVPDPTGMRSNEDRRNDHLEDSGKPQFARYAGKRYKVETDVTLKNLRTRKVYHTKTLDLSQTGMLIALPEDDDEAFIIPNDPIRASFRLEAGMLPEGAEKHYRVRARAVRVSKESNVCALEFKHPLYWSRKVTTDTVLFSVAAFFLALVTLVILLMRIESIHYFARSPILYGYSILTAMFLLSRYLFGMFYRPVPVDPEFTPSVTIIIPCFNEETWIRRTIISCVDQDYPPEQLEFVIVDDGSSDNSVEVIKKTIEDLCREGERFRIKPRIRFFQQNYNQGKREAMGLGINNARTELIAFVDSDSFLEPDAIRNLVQPFKDPKMGGVAGRTDVVNTYTNHLTKMQSVRYYISFRMMKAAEALFDSVMCLSGPLSCYRIEAVREVFDRWINQKFLGQKATFGDDRSLTNMIVEHHRTYYQDTSICSTIVPNRHKQFLKQQMRWKRSWLRESLTAARFIWKKEPLMSFFFYLGLLVPIIAPIIVVYNLIYVPLVMHVAPTTFLIGLLMMALMMSFAQLILKKSSLWIYGLIFCLYYEIILLWQMPWAWLTFWVSNWGTRGNGKKKAKSAPAESSEPAMENETCQETQS